MQKAQVVYDLSHSLEVRTEDGCRGFLATADSTQQLHVGEDALERGAPVGGTAVRFVEREGHV